MSDEVKVHMRPVCLVAGLLVALLGIWLLRRQDLYISTGPAGSLDPSVNWWGLGMGIGLLTGGTGGFIGAVTRHRGVLIASGLLICLSSIWHPLFWPALTLTAPLFVLASITDTTTSSTASQPHPARHA